MARTPKRLVGPTTLAGTATTIYTVPSVTKTILRQIYFQNPSASPITITLSIGTDAAATRILDAQSIPANTVGSFANIFTQFCYRVLLAGEVLQAFASTATVIVVTIDGDEYTL